MATLAVIPARFASTRLPGKPLLDLTGKPLVVHVLEQARRAARVDRVLVATDDQRIAAAVREHGGEVVMTRADHPNGTSRIAEAVDQLDAALDLVVNIQGDEPEIEPALVDAVIERLAAGEEPMATVASPFGSHEDPADPNIVKVVLNQRGQAMYFSRCPIPHDRDRQGVMPLKHVGLYAYRRAFLPTYIALSATPAEQAEQLEQLRVLEHGHAIACIVRQTRHVGIDTAEQYDAFVKRYRS
jgi:3-deoxy-manno-octulosonate cytidylyltransferase (CMP-KDO synthetase)